MGQISMERWSLKDTLRLAFAEVTGVEKSPECWGETEAPVGLGVKVEQRCLETRRAAREERVKNKALGNNTWKVSHGEERPLVSETAVALSR